jgi:hypothetical protein
MYYRVIHRCRLMIITICQTLTLSTSSASANKLIYSYLRISASETMNMVIFKQSRINLYFLYMMHAFVNTVMNLRRNLDS